MSERTYRIVTDATSDLSKELIQDLDITVIPLDVELDGTIYEFKPECEQMSASAFYDCLRHGKRAKTSQINNVIYRRYFEEILKQGEDVLYLGFSSALSGTLQSAILAARDLEQEYPGARVACVDTLAASVGEGMLVYAAAQRQKAGASLDEAIQWVQENRNHLCHWFIVEDLQYLAKGGRVSSVAATFGTILGVKPIMHVDEEGRLVPVGKVKGRKKAIKALVDKMETTQIKGQNDVVFIGHGDCPQDAEYLRELVRERFGTEQFIIHDVGPILGAHAGADVLALFFFGEQK